jgi:uncharacterized membrane protein
VETTRLEAFSDAVIAILITIMVLELEVPEQTDLSALRPLWPVFLSYLLSFVHLGIYWNNHHHLFQASERINGAAMWANLHLLFWLSLFPWATAWVGEHRFRPVPTAVYGVVLLAAAIAYYVLQRAIIACEGPGSSLQEAVGRDLKGRLSPVIYAVGLLLALAVPALGLACYVAVAVTWLIPDRRPERRLAGNADGA